MQHKTRFTFFALLLVLLTAGGGEALTIKSFDGKQTLAINQIPNIVRFTTGQEMGDVQYRKDSLMLLNAWKDGSHYMRTYPSLLNFGADGGSKTFASLNYTTEHTTWSGPFNYSNLPGAVLSTRGKDGTFYAIQHQLPVWLRVVYWHDDHLNASNSFASISAFGLHHTASDMKAGMTVKDFDGEVIAFCTRNNEGDRVQVNFAEAHADDSTLGISITPLSQTWASSVADDGKNPTMLDGTEYCPVSMAVGDFDGDGYVNEVVVVWSDTATVYYHLLQLTYANGGFTLKSLDGGRVHTYDYAHGPNNSYTTYQCLDEYKARGQNMDGLMGSYSCCVVAGDFDGKGKDKFAVVWRDVQPQDGKFTSGSYSSREPQWYGYTGRIHVKTYQWNGSSFSTEEDVQAYDKHNVTWNSKGSFTFGWWVDSDAPIGVKAAVGDFDGDGRDELAVLRVMLQWSKYCKYDDPKKCTTWDPYDSNLVFGAFVDLYTFDYGSTKPNYQAHPTNYGSNGN